MNWDDIIKLGIFGVTLLFVIMLLIKVNVFKMFFYFIRSVFKQRMLIMELAKKDLRKKYLGSFLGVFWAFINPLMEILIIWFAFSVGLRGGGDISGVPFILWFFAGMVSWFFLSEQLNAGARSIIEYSFLIKKIYMQSSIIPIVKLVSSLVTHIFFIIVMLGLYFIYGKIPGVKVLQIFYYLFASIVFLLGVSWLTASISPFIKDVSHVVMVVVRFLFWFTPIIWDYNRLENSTVKYIVKLNPLFYIVKGYRDSFIGREWFWEKVDEMIIFWITTIVILFVGVLFFRKLKPHFSDVL